ncbi:MAG TPA: metal ABC transporter ATP-binding protein [Anaeromyxobacteraceae bacterium]|nr:metal ABC transporter ATP-binding protein [Anaeromyxobacteraceae bacterium]
MAAATANALEVEHLDVRFGEKQILTDLSFYVPSGSALAIIGPNGAGKTVLFKALIGALPYRGSIRWGPFSRLGYVPQKLDIERDLPLTGMELLRAKASIARTPRTDIERVLSLLGLPLSTAHDPIGTLSGGQFQRLLLAFALLARPTVLLFDEPTAGVDRAGEGLLYETIHRLQLEQKLTLLLISHELSVVYRHASAVLCLGREHPFFGPPDEILTPDVMAQAYGAPIGFHRHDAHD